MQIRISVRVLACFTLQAFNLRSDTSFVLSGSEADMQRALRQQPELIERMWDNADDRRTAAFCSILISTVVAAALVAQRRAKHCKRRGSHLVAQALPDARHGWPGAASRLLEELL